MVAELKNDTCGTKWDFYHTQSNNNNNKAEIVALSYDVLQQAANGIMFVFLSFCGCHWFCTKRTFLRLTVISHEIVRHFKSYDNDTIHHYDDTVYISYISAILNNLLSNNNSNIYLIPKN